MTYFTDPDPRNTPFEYSYDVFQGPKGHEIPSLEPSTYHITSPQRLEKTAVARIASSLGVSDLSLACLFQYD
jgi:hypothetical protein